jgi:lysozyme
LRVLLALAVVAGAAAGAWYVVLPEYRPTLRAGERYGIDVSHHQGVIDWPAVARDHISFAYIKGTEGGDHVDRLFADNWRGARAAGLRIGAYHFFTLCSPGETQAANFLGTVPDDTNVLPPAVDLELAGNCGDRPSRDAMIQELDRFLQRVEAATGQQAVLYVGADFDGHYRLSSESGRPLWHRRWYRRPSFDSWLIWQLTGIAHVRGIDGDVDLNIGRFG